MFFENKKRGNSRIIKLFGKIIYVTTSGYKRRTQRFFGNLIFTEKIEKKYTEIKTTKIFNKIIAQRITDEDYKKEYRFGRLVKSIDLKQKFLNQYSKYISGYDDVLILRANSGEIYLFLTYILDSFIKNIAAKKVLLVATKKYHIDLINLLCPEIAYVYVKQMPIFRNLHTKIGDINIYTLFTGDHFIQVENDIKNNPLDTAHYFYSIVGNLGIKKDDLNFRRAVVPDNVQHSLEAKIKKIKLNIDNFVFIAPEACSCEEYDNDFWVDLCNELNKLGVDVFMNIVDDDTDIVGCEYKTCKLTFSEAFALAKLSRGVVSLRSGLTESLLQTNAPLFSLYTKFRNRYVFKDMAVEFVLSGFGLNKLPDIDKNKLFEFNMSEMLNDEVIDKIINEIKETQIEIV